MQRQGQRYKLSDTDKQRRLDERRREQQTAPFRERYAKRAGQESTNSGRKRRQGLGYLRVAGWNLLQAMKSASLMAKVRAILAQRGLGGRFFAFQLRWLRQVRTVRRWPATKRQQFMLRPT